MEGGVRKGRSGELFHMGCFAALAMTDSITKGVPMVADDSILLTFLQY